MQRRHVVLGNPPPHKPVFTEDPSSLQAPPPPTQNTKHDYVTKPVSLKQLKPRPLQPLSGGGAAAQSLHSSAAAPYTSVVLRKSFPSKPPTA